MLHKYYRGERGSKYGYNNSAIIEEKKNIAGCDLGQSEKNLSLLPII